MRAFVSVGHFTSYPDGSRNVPGLVREFELDLDDPLEAVTTSSYRSHPPDGIRA
jgi:hypothetical protein